MSRRPRIAIGPGEVAGYFARLKLGLDAEGVTSEHFLLAPNRFQYGQHRHFLDSASAKALSLRRSKLAPVRIIGLLLATMLRALTFAYAVARYDTFVFNGSWSFFKFRELWLLKLLNKKVAVIFLGSDARPPILCGRHLDDEGGLVESAAAARETQEIYKKVRRIERHADWIINHTATDHFFTRPYVRSLAIGVPIASGPCPPEATIARAGVRIVHAPSRPIAKGSHIFRQIVEELRGEGFAIDYVELVGVPNSCVLEELKLCDFVLDELYSDTPMATFATEAAHFGKPAVVGSYYAEDFSRHNPDDLQPPSLFVLPGDVKAAVRRMVADEAFRLSLGLAARAFVSAHWEARAVASRLLKVLADDVPASWMADPQHGLYIWGWGLPKADWHRQVRAFVDLVGLEGLRLSHNERLVREIERQIAQ